MGWVARNGALNQTEMENNADIVIAYYRSLGYADETIASILGNMENESTINPLRQETGGQGFGLVQWTPVSSLQTHCANANLSPYTDGDVQLQVIVTELLGQYGNNEWYTTSAFIRPYYNSGATSDMIGITGNQFIHNTMGWTPDKLAIMFMVGYERPSYNPSTNHYQRRMASALRWYQYMGNNPITRTSKKFNFLLFNRKRRMGI